MKKRVLIVDDSQTVLAATSALLEQAGFEVQTMHEPQQFGMVQSPDLVLLDVNMPVTTGDNVYTLFRDHLGVTAPVFFYSAQTEDALRELAEKLGAAGYICKSWGPERLLEEVNKHLGDD